MEPSGIQQSSLTLEPICSASQLCVTRSDDSSLVNEALITRCACVAMMAKDVKSLFAG